MFVPLSSKIIHSVRNCRNKGFPLLWQVIHLAVHKPTLEASHASSPCVRVKHWETVKRANRGRTGDGLRCYPQSVHKTKPPVKDLLFFFLLNTSTFLQWQEKTAKLVTFSRKQTNMLSYLPTSRWWRLVACVIAVRALSHSKPQRLKPRVFVHFCFVFFTVLKCAWERKSS